MGERFFHLGDALSITSGYLLSPRGIDGVYDILNFLTGDHLFTHQLPRGARVAAPYLLERYADPLGSLTERARVARERLGDAWGDQCQAWLIDLCAERGSSDLILEPMPAGRWLSIDPLKELCAMVGDEKIIVVAPEVPRVE